MPGEQSSYSSRGGLEDSDWFLEGAEREGEITVLLIGMTGTGKSTVGNLLLYGDEDPEENPEDIFNVGHGRDSKTQTCQYPMRVFDRCRLTVVDTPGVPDTGRAKTFERFDEVVHQVGQMSALNVIMFVLRLGRHDDASYKKYSALLRQFKRLPQTLMILCNIKSHKGKRKMKRQLDVEASALVGDFIRK